VGFVSRDEETLDYKGSAFVVLVPHDANTGCLHIVTAKHVATALQSGEAMIAMNGKDGLPLWVKNATEVPWFFHPDESIDVAVLPMASARLHDYDYQEISTSMFATPQRIADYGIGVGDEIVCLGLFSPFVGRSRFTPIARSGIISMMPDGELPHPGFIKMEAYLVESRSMGGMSGSPIFVRNTIHPQAANSEGKTVQFSVSSDFHLLGLLSGHWAAAGNVNMGLSLVVPASKILETLFHPHLIAIRQEAFDRGLVPDART
jgi:hypothetical protein